MAQDGVPANSASESHVKDPNASSTAATPGNTTDSSKPLMTPVGAGGSSGDATPSSDNDSKSAGVTPAAGTKPDPKAPKKTGPVSKKECEAAADHGLDLLIASKPELQGIPPEMMAQFKQQAFSKESGNSPCAGKGISRAEYDCEMAAPSFDAYGKCSKGKK
jgi:hypothetical protein